MESTPTKGTTPPVPRLRNMAVGVFTVPEVADLLKVSTATVYSLVERGLLPHFRVSNSIRIRRVDLDGFIGAS